MSLQIEDDSVWNPYAKYEETIESLRQQLAESESERLEQARLLGCSAEREAALLAEIERLKSEHAQAAQRKAPTNITV